MNTKKKKKKKIPLCAQAFNINFSCILLLLLHIFQLYLQFHQLYSLFLFFNPFSCLFSNTDK